ncbi:MAG: GNAT family N-acetyltransferase [Cyclobacteriaceae bacterium]
MKDISSIRKATSADLSAIVKMLADDPLGAKREHFRDPLPKAYHEAFEAIDGDPNQALMVAEIEGAVVGTFQLTYIPYLTYQGSWRVQIEAVRVHSDHRGQGLGKQLFEWAIEQAKEKGAHVLQLTTNKQRPDALAFYKSLGFVASHEGMKLHLR